MKNVLTVSGVALLVLVCAVSALAVASGKEPAKSTLENLVLSVGEQRVLDAQDIASFSESNRGIIEVKIPKDGSRMVLNAQSPGRMTLLLIRRDGEEQNIDITVVERDPAAITEELRDLLADQAGVRLRRVGPRVFIDGQVDSEAALARAEQIAALYPGQVMCLATVGRSVKPRTNIRLDLTFVEFHTSASMGGGVNWPAQLGNTGTFEMTTDLMTGFTSASYKVVDQAMPSLEAAASRGYAKILKQASLFTTSGNRASYNSGGEVNIAIAGSQAAEMRTISYGCSLSVMPLLDSSHGLVDLEVEAEVSELKETSQSIPGRTVSKVNTLVHLGLGQSIILSGLDSKVESRSKSGLPFLSRIPIFGLLFGNHRKRSEEMEGIIAITPVVIDHLQSDSRRRIEKSLDKFKTFKF